ncbi:MAG: hypothetical protein JRH20_13195 [Deltaproteobacteria bacterium]|nr:hypothetical protein [Deltaproteobacteria bacterium]
MLSELFKQLDTLTHESNRERTEEGVPTITVAEFRVVGQMALWEADLGLDLAATHDLDAFVRAEYWTQKRFEELLGRHGLILDEQSELIWMPQETAYQTIYQGRWVTGMVAQPEYVLISKARTAPQKNRSLLIEYIAQRASDLFFTLAETYKLDLEGLMQDDI